MAARMSPIVVDSQQDLLGHAALRIPAGRLHECLVGIAPQPILARLQRANDLMLGGVLAGMPAGVLVLRGVAAPHLPIGHTHSQVNPGVAKIKTLLTTCREWRDVVDLIKVGARHRGLAAYPLEGKPDALQQSHGRLLLSGPRVSHQQSPAWCGVPYGRSPS
jgi:hypothetical protein